MQFNPHNDRVVRDLKQMVDAHPEDIAELHLNWYVEWKSEGVPYFVLPVVDVYFKGYIP